MSMLNLWFNDELIGELVEVNNVWSFTYSDYPYRKARKARTFSAGMDSAGSEAALQSPYPYLLMA